MINLTLICVGSLKENYLREAAGEYIKRLSQFAKLSLIELKESKLPDKPSEKDIAASLEDEADRIIEKIPPKAAKIALCIEGKQFSSEELAGKIEALSQKSGEICFIIGSSFGLSERVKEKCELRLSFSKLTFPHQLMRVIFLEAVYRCFNIISGTKYHK